MSTVNEEKTATKKKILMEGETAFLSKIGKEKFPNINPDMDFRITEVGDFGGWTLYKAIDENGQKYDFLEGDLV